VKDASEQQNMLHHIAREFFDSFCRSYIEEICKSSLKLEIEPPTLQGEITPTLEAMSQERLKSSSKIVSGLQSNAARLAGHTIILISAGLTSEQGKEATKYALSLVAKHHGLNSFERSTATEWIAQVSWVRPL
jgi:hypothetical protein